MPVDDLTADDRQPDQEPPHPQRRRRVVAWALGVFGGIVLVLLAGYLIDLGVTSGEIERGTSIAGVPVGGMTPEQAGTTVREHLGPRYTAELELTAHGKAVTMAPADAGLGIDIAGAVAAAGTRSASPLARLTSFFHEEDISPSVAVDRAALGTWVNDVAARTDVAAVEGRVRLVGTEVRSRAPVVGKRIDTEAAVSAIADAWRQSGPDGTAGLQLPVVTEPVRTTAEEVDRAERRATAILSGPVAVRIGGETTTIDVPTIAERTTVRPDGNGGFTVAVDASALRRPMTEAISATERQPKDASIGLVDGEPQITESQAGRTVDWKASEAALSKVLTTRSSGDGPRQWEIAYRPVEPEFSTADAKALGLNTVISEFTTSGFSWASGQNIKTVAAEVNGAIVRPGETFSLNGFTGHRGVEQGYIESGIIEEGRPGTAVGGGISQFATTLFNAAYFAGMRDVSHTPHSYYISRYPAGREATVYEGAIDLVFANDSPTAVMIQTIWTDYDITVRLWGTKHVEVESITGDPYNYTSPPQTVIPYGEECVPSSGSSGFTVDDTRIVRDLQGNEVSRNSFTTVYNGQYQVVCEPPPPPPPTEEKPEKPETPADQPPADEPPADEPQAGDQGGAAAGG